MTNTKLKDIEENLLDYYFNHGLRKCADRFGMNERDIAAIMREAGVPVRKVRTQGPLIAPSRPAATPRRLISGVGGGRLTAAQRAALRAEFVPGQRGENTRLMAKYGITSAGVSFLTKALR